MRAVSLITSRDLTGVRPRVFVSYRRKDTRHAAGRLGDMLSEDFDLFMDVDDIAPGTDYTLALQGAVDASQVMLALIGPEWENERDEFGRRRIDNPDDWVAHEIAVGLQRNIVVIPVLIDGARMPDREDLPPHLADLANRHAFRLHHESFADDADRLRRAIHRVVNGWPEPEHDSPEPQPFVPAPAPPPVRTTSRPRRRGVIAITVMLVLAALIGGAAIAIYQFRVLRPGETRTFDSHRVTVRDISYDPAYGYLVEAQVCVRKPIGNAPTTRLTWRAWSVVNQSGQIFTPSLINDAAVPPRMYPRDGRYAVGQCASGVIPFAGLPEGSTITQVFYKGSTNSATWRV
jgi:hypothetical protein